MDTFTIHAEQVDVQEIMKEIHRRVLEKKQRGVYNDDELRRIAELKSDLSPKQNANLNEMNLHLRRLHVNWDVAASSAIIRSHRKVIGPMFVAIKRELQKINWATHSLLCHNTAFDGLILSHHYGIVPSRYYDTLSMARGLHSNEIGGGLE